MKKIAGALALFALPLVHGACAPGGAEESPSDPANRSTEGLQVCAKGSTQKGIDVSEHNGTVSWTKVKAAGRSFAFARVSDGLDYPDDTFADNWSGMKAAGLVRGAYQYFRPGQDAVKQADLLIARVGALGAGDLPPVIDVETANGQSGATVVKGVRAWIDRVKARTGRDPIIYAAAGFWDTLPGTAQFAGNVLWVANYGQQCPYLPQTWSKWAFWQSSDTGSVSGVAGAVDVNVFNGTLAELMALGSGGGTATCKTDDDCHHGAKGAAVICANTGAVAGQCIDGCHGDTDCPAPGTCDTTLPHWQCTNAPLALGAACTTDAECGGPGSARVCGASSHTCVIGCHGDADCPSGTACDKSGSAWVCAPTTLPLGAPCTADSQCGGPGDARVCSTSSHTCIKGCHLDADCPSGTTCDESKSPWQCATAPAPSGCPVLTYPSGIHIQTVKSAATTASYNGHLKPGEKAPECFLDVSKLHDPVAQQTYDMSVSVAAHFQLSELVGTEVDQGYGNFVLLAPAAVASLEDFRQDVGGPVSINSGFRSPKHQEDVCVSICGDPYGCPGLCSNNSRHMWGDAFDLPLAFYSSYYTNLACEDGFKFAYLESGTHLHIDQNPAYAVCVQQ